MRFIIFITLLFAACKEPDSVTSEDQRVSQHERSSGFDQIVAKVIAEPSMKGRIYIITITNQGEIPFCVSGLVRQQWALISSENEGSWEEQTNRHAHSHDVPILAPGESFKKGVEPWTRGDAQLRFGFVTRCIDDDTRTLVIWSEPVNPPKD